MKSLIPALVAGAALLGQAVAGDGPNSGIPGHLPKPAGKPSWFDSKTGKTVEVKLDEYFQVRDGEQTDCLRLLVDTGAGRFVLEQRTAQSRTFDSESRTHIEPGRWNVYGEGKLLCKDCEAVRYGQTQYSLQGPRLYKHVLQIGGKDGKGQQRYWEVSWPYTVPTQPMAACTAQAV
ncbi:hypothetical protein [Chitinimonas lacunae]|uniref:Uncharacterized protein n=1 Tax=Chitinimonas lacunae TaxID=1963018 RepID=A0ABV8MWB8_9NEIS